MTEAAQDPERVDGKAVAVAFSGGAVSSALVARLAREGARVLAIAVDTGALSSPEAVERSARQALALGALRHVAVDAREETFARHVAYLVKANLERAGYLTAAAERTAQASQVAVVAAREGATVLVHGARGSDAVRFELAARALAPGLEVRAPARDEGFTRTEAWAFLESQELLGAAGLAVGGAPDPERVHPTIGFLGSVATGGELADPASAPDDDDAFPFTTPPSEAADVAEEFDVDFEAGVPTGAFGARLDGVLLLRRLNDAGRRHGVGRGVVTGDTVTGEKRRHAFEAPALAILVAAHRELERLVLTSWQRLVKDQVALVYGQLFDDGLYREPALRDIEALLDSSQRNVTGTARVRLYRGACSVVAVESPRALLERTQDGESGLYDARDARGFARVLGVPGLLSARRDARAGHGAEVV